MIVCRGAPAYRGYALGPAFRFFGLDSVPRALALPMPAVIVASYADRRTLGMLDLSRVYAVALDHGSFADPAVEALADLRRPAVIGARGIFRAARDGATVVVDGVAGAAILDPTPEVLARYKKLRGTAPPREDPIEAQILERFAAAIRSSKLRRKAPLPYDLPEEQRLLGLARKLAKGARATAEDEAFLRRVLEIEEG